MRELWADGWRLGRNSAVQITSIDLDAPDSSLQSILDEGDRRVGGLVATRVTRLEQALLAAVAGGLTAGQLTGVLDGLLGNEPAALVVTQTEVTWSMSLAALAYYQQARIAAVGWATAGDATVCAVCDGNEAAGLIPVGDEFPSGDDQPPAHPNCRCSLYPGDTGQSMMPADVI